MSKGIGSLCNSCHKVSMSLEFLQVVLRAWYLFGEALPSSRVGHDDPRPGGGVHGVSGHDLPVVKDALGEGLTTGRAPQAFREAWKTR